MLSTNSILFESCHEIEILFEKFDEYFTLLWMRVVSLDKLYLWEEGGHSSTPIKQFDWTIKQLIFNLLRDMMGNLPLPSFIDNTFSPLSSLEDDVRIVSTNNSNNIGNDNLMEVCNQEFIKLFHSLRYDHEFISEWLGLLCTFYWSSTNEISLMSRKLLLNNNQKSLPNIDYNSLIQKLKLKVDKKIQMIISKMGNNYIEELTPKESISLEEVETEEKEDVNTNETSIQYEIIKTPRSQCSGRIDFELQQISSLIVMAITEQDIIGTFLYVSDLLGKVNSHILF